MMDEIAIRLVQAGPRPSFALEVGLQAPRVATVAVTDLGTDRPVWWLVPESFHAVLPFTLGEVSKEDVEHLADAEPLDPIEDLPPSDPRHKAALRDRDPSNESVFPRLGAFTYGVIPARFRQAAPEGGVDLLAKGRRYAVVVMGPEGHGGLEFLVE
jgi:hypothetical protein